MARRRDTFTCFIQDRINGDKYSADVEIIKRAIIRPSLQHDGKIDLADVFLTSVSGHFGTLHHHFVIQSLNGDGLYIFRTALNNEERRYCNIWDLGPAFGDKVTKTLKAWA